MKCQRLPSPLRTHTHDPYASTLWPPADGCAPNWRLPDCESGGAEEVLRLYAAARSNPHPCDHRTQDDTTWCATYEGAYWCADADDKEIP